MRPLGFAVALTGLAALAAGQGAVRPPERPAVSGLVPGVDLTSPEALGWTREQHELAQRYSRGSWTLAFVGPLVSMASLALLAFTGLAGRLEAALRARLGSRLARDALFVVAMVLLLAALGFPLEVYRFLRERRYGFATQEFAAWLGDEMKGLVIACLIGVIVLVPIWAAIRRWPRGWWLLGSAIGVAASVLIIAVAPVFIAPLFNTFTPLRDASLKARILQLAHREGIRAKDVYEVDASRQSRHDNAYVAGLLGTQRIVLYDTLIAAYTPEEIEFVMAHEMGHYVRHHVWKGVAAAAVAILAGFFLLHLVLERTVRALAPRLGYASVSSMAAAPLALLYLSAYLFLIQPAASAFSRHLEHQADLFALRTVDATQPDRAASVSAFQKMAARNLSDPNPPAFIVWWLYSHPSIGDRIRLAAGR